MIRQSSLLLVICLSGCGGVVNPASPPNDFSDGNFATHIVASNSCSTLPDAARSRNWNIGLVKTGPTVLATMEGWPDSMATVISQTNLAGTANGSSLMLAGYIYDTIVGCEAALCYRAEGTVTATQSGNVISGTLTGVVGYDATTCTATDHKVTFTRR
jgi:hypothetical protein